MKCSMKHSMIRSQSGQALSEYLILTILIAMVAIGMTRGLGKAIKGRLHFAQKQIDKLQVR